MLEMWQILGTLSLICEYNDIFTTDSNKKHVHA